jgi:succinoglycan biosynthesis protein ExoV
MEIFYYRDPKRNFGDDLNRVLWSHVLPRRMLEADDVVLIGIGSILSEEWAGRFSRSKKKVIVLGTGTSYDLPPSDMSDWSILAVRGPLTAAVIGMPEKAVTDGAILLADAPGLIGQPQQRNDIVFMPHYHSLRRWSHWESIAAAAGMRMVTPRQPVGDILKAFAKARLVVTEAMHGAIVADTLRIPWIPIVILPTVDEFKWRDWCQSMELPFAPQSLPAGSADDAMLYRKLNAILAQAGVAGHRHLEGTVERSDLLAYLARRYSPATKSALQAAAHDRLRRLIALPCRLADPRYQAKAQQALRRIAEGEPFLSSDPVFASRLQQMREAAREAASLALGRAIA